ncbi:MAG: alpha-hydroxy-acid oxidizing protein [Candidatus Tectomicrobia bacterium]|uniref:Alpha-hydroxy-acid oxidizing protein n=1 Tax=Tectimicrobiota bacterium TaxID=2528274 RepID=A0A937W422_UNCTE|nr:alpha-hydroxy-acid oxidizing protein [Candidatus Tectomicrobia bacterium]
MAERFMTLPEIERAAQSIVPPGPYGYGAGGAETETTLRRNRRALDRLAIRQHILVDVRQIDLSTTFLGMELPSPVAIAPMGGLVLFHPQGDVEMARGAAPTGNLAVVSGVTGWSVEDVAAAAQGPLIFQLYHNGPRSWVKELLGRVETSGYRAVCLTVDVQVYGRRERDLEQRFDPRTARLGAPNPPPPDSTYPARLTWDDVAWLQENLSIPVGLKGILTAQDARRAVDAGVKIIWVSNHGGRQLDHAQATIDVLPEIVEAVAGRAEIVIDGGFRRGTDVVKALALGANIVAMGRTMLWGLAVDGAAGVARTLEILRHEISTTLALSGHTSVRELEPSHVCRAEPD